MAGLLPDGCKTVNRALRWYIDNCHAMRREQEEVDGVWHGAERNKQIVWQAISFAYARPGFSKLEDTDK